MIELLHNRLALLSISFILLLSAFPLISVGLTSGPSPLWWLGLAALTCGGVIPPARRLILGSAHDSKPDDTEPTSPEGTKK